VRRTCGAGALATVEPSVCAASAMRHVQPGAGLRHSRTHRPKRQRLAAYLRPTQRACVHARVYFVCVCGYGVCALASAVNVCTWVCVDIGSCAMIIISVRRGSDLTERMRRRTAGRGARRAAAAVLRSAVPYGVEWSGLSCAQCDRLIQAVRNECTMQARARLRPAITAIHRSAACNIQHTMQHTTCNMQRSDRSELAF
jgi:hypothetical protein